MLIECAGAYVYYNKTHVTLIRRRGPEKKIFFFFGCFVPDSKAPLLKILATPLSSASHLPSLEIASSHTPHLPNCHPYISKHSTHKHFLCSYIQFKYTKVLQNFNRNNTHKYLPLLHLSWDFHYTLRMFADVGLVVREMWSMRGCLFQGNGRCGVNDLC